MFESLKIGFIPLQIKTKVCWIWTVFMNSKINVKVESTLSLSRNAWVQSARLNLHEPACNIRILFCDLVPLWQ